MNSGNAGNSGAAGIETIGAIGAGCSTYEITSGARMANKMYQMDVNRWVSIGKHSQESDFESFSLPGGW